MERKILALYLRQFWFGSLPPLVRDGDRFLNLRELEALSEQDRFKFINELPIDFKGYPWQHCQLGCPFWKDEGTECQRHAQLCHPGSSISEIFDKPFICNFRIARPLGALNLPDGPLTHCFQTFTTKAALTAHKEVQGHKLAKKAKPPRNVAPNADPPHPPPPLPPPTPPHLPEADGDNLQPMAAAPRGNPTRPSRKRKRDEMEEMEEMENLPEPPPKSARLDETSRPPRRGLDLKTTFYNALDTIQSRIDAKKMDLNAAIDEITRMIATKAFVRSDSVELFARGIRREAKLPDTTPERKEELYKKLLDELKSLDWN